MQLKDKKILVIGLGISGQSAARFLLSQGAIVDGVDQNHDNLKNSANLTELRCKGLHTYHEAEAIEIKKYDMVLTSPGIPKTNPHFHKAEQANIELIGEVELACRFLSKKMIGITGTNGKTTVTLLVEHVLKQCGFKASALGNVGVPITSQLMDTQALEKLEIIVAELSSYQLETLRCSTLDAAVILNITPDHLDRYGTMEDYAKAKIHIKDCLKSGKPLYIEENCAEEYRTLLGDFPFKTYGYKKGSHCFTDFQKVYFDGQAEMLLPESLTAHVSHDLENMLAAYSLCREFGVTFKQFESAFKTFKKPSHRIEFVREVKNVSYIDDSKGTNIDAVIRAVQCIRGTIILIAGGVDKGAAYTPWIQAFEGRVRMVMAIGQAAEKIYNDLSSALPVKLCHNLEDAVKQAALLANPGETVLLSPGCSSFDMFKDYAHRGDEFKRIVNALPEINTLR